MTHITEPLQKSDAKALTSQFMSVQAVRSQFDIIHARPLGVVSYANSESRPNVEGNVPNVSIHLCKGASLGFSEIWFASGNIHSGRDGDIVFSYDDHFMFCVGDIRMGEQCANDTKKSYTHLFSLLDRFGFRNIFRMWNFIPKINEDNADGLEIYKDFCRGRAEAFDTNPYHLHRMPAATGVGSFGENIVFYLLAARSAKVTHIENHRQIPAYRYPDRYGPKSPSFARATHVCTADDQQALFISGTGSILGHETVHIGNIALQCEVALENIANLISGDNLRSYGLSATYTLKDIDHIKVYVRHEADLATVRRACSFAFSPTAQIEYLLVNMCRQDLLIEIEGILPF